MPFPTLNVVYVDIVVYSRETAVIVGNDRNKGGMFHVKHQISKNDMFISIREYSHDNYPFEAFLGGRGTGKTYSAIDCLITDYEEKKSKSVWMRRTEREFEMLCDSRTRGEGVNMFKSYNENNDRKFGMVPIQQKIAGIYEREWGEDGKLKIISECYGYFVPMSGIATIRGIDFTDCDSMYYDEFIPEKHVNKMKGEGDAFLNAIETIARNRELLGKPPLKVYMLSNSNTIQNAIFMKLNIVEEIERNYIRGKRMDIYFKDRGLAIHMLPPTKKFKEQKAKTALYKLAKGTDFSEMALENKFAYDDFSLVGWQNVKGMKPICQIDDAYVWANNREAYITHTPAKNLKRYRKDIMQEAKDFRYTYGADLNNLFIKDALKFETFQIKINFLEIMLLN